MDYDKLIYESSDTYVESLINIKNIIFKYKEEFKDNIDQFDHAERKLRIVLVTKDFDILINKTSPLVLKFKKEILQDKVQELLNYDYEKLLYDDIKEENKETIITLIKCIKLCWLKLKKSEQNRIKKLLKSMITSCELYMMTIEARKMN